MKNKCLYCYKEINAEELKTPAGQTGYHPKCSKKFFGKPSPPLIDFSEDQIVQLAERVVKSQKTVTGVQPKLSLGLSTDVSSPERFTIVGLWGEYILKPQTELFDNLPEIEDVTMHLAEISKIKTVQHSLIRLQSGQLAYITKRIDRNKGKKLHMEDMCQLTERLTEYKYKGSHEQIVKVIKKHTANSGLNVTDYYEMVLFCFLTGNNDMHLKNFSLLKRNGNYDLCPAYDMVASELVVEGDDEELALNLNGKKKKIKRKDFETAMTAADMSPKVIENIFKKYKKLLPKWYKFIQESFLPETMKDEYIVMIQRKAIQIEL
ncbi:HipA domain-containing protein [Flammeovirga yaeyamensis]|uniref:HipA domain-containing protein n=1 Tax=Flammeovirga yaeyamensis TaxID=367791 RepID=A0AAX1NCD9_9BACT|nr:HipA domain-containing protein [Flammeovirga yaeyamensis]MBB3696801.1 serine/threonine-protein kinase HipA [Flammeovirga yaeyamensis]NMF33467.1 HipA domain-containing protein [Flammeovirga yaeyamensis]QWG05259.1 HipA domain-containing protein [Flammeovirga yaeyamensis]